MIAIIEYDGDRKYFERVALESLINTKQSGDKKVFQQALHAVVMVESLEDVPEFESSIPEQPSLFR